jgi:hypothetical protein
MRTDILLTVEAVDSKRSVAMIRQTDGKVRLEHCIDKMRPQFERWMKDGLREPIGAGDEERHTAPEDPLFLPRLKDYIAKYSLTGTLAKIEIEDPPPEPTFEDEIVTLMDTFAPMPVAYLFMDCTAGYIARRALETLHAKTEQPPCQACLVILDAMTKEEATALPDAKLRKRKCGKCPDWHWSLTDMPSIGITQLEKNFEGHENCIALFTFVDKKPRFVVTPDTCPECAKALPAFGKIQSIIMGEAWPIERGA